MSYMQDYEDYNSNSKKIPYDDIPISRKSQGKKPLSVSFSGFKVLIILVAVLFVSNIALIITSLYYLNNGIVREVNYYDNQIIPTTNVSAMATSTAKWSSVCVAAGGTCYDEYSFFTSTKSQGSGVILSINKAENYAYILTCHHVIDGYESSVYVLFPTMFEPVYNTATNTDKVSVVGYSSYYDIAVIKVKGINKYFECQEIKVYDSTYISDGDTVFAIGNSLSAGLSVTSGVVSRVNTLTYVEGNNFVTREIQISAEINPGNSGGGLFNDKGQFVGLVNARIHNAKIGGKIETVFGTSFAIPGTFAINIANNIIKNNGAPEFASIGVSFEHQINYGKGPVYVKDGNNETKEIERYYAYVSNVNNGSDADGSTGLQVNDIIVGFRYTDINGVKHGYANDSDMVPMYNKYSFEDICFNIKEKTNVTFIVKRKTNTTIEVTFKANTFEVK